MRYPHFHGIYDRRMNTRWRTLKRYYERHRDEADADIIGGIIRLASPIDDSKLPIIAQMVIRTLGRRNGKNLRRPKPIP